MVADAIKAGVPIRLPLTRFPVRVLPLAADYSDLTPTEQVTQPGGSLSQPSTNTQHSVSTPQEAPLLRKLPSSRQTHLLHLLKCSLKWSLWISLASLQAPGSFLKLTGCIL